MLLISLSFEQFKPDHRIVCVGGDIYWLSSPTPCYKSNLIWSYDECQRYEFADVFPIWRKINFVLWLFFFLGLSFSRVHSWFNITDTENMCAIYIFIGFSFHCLVLVLRNSKQCPHWYVNMMCYMEIYLVITFKGLFTVWPVHRQLETGLSVMEVLGERKSMQVVENRGVRARLYKLIWHSLLWFPFLEGEVKWAMFDYYLRGNWADCHVKYMDRREQILLFTWSGALSLISFCI